VDQGGAVTAGAAAEEVDEVVRDEGEVRRVEVRRVRGGRRLQAQGHIRAWQGLAQGRRRREELCGEVGVMERCRRVVFEGDGLP
jgi:hypothetical protein